MKLNKSIHWYYVDVLDLLLDGHKVRGWKRFKSTYRTMDAFYSTKLGVVIKKPKFIMEHRTPLKFRVPTYELIDGFIVQPLVSKKNLGLAVKKIQSDMKPYLKRGIFPDLHVGNVGWYKGKPLMFDW